MIYIIYLSMIINVREIDNIFSIVTDLYIIEHDHAVR